MAKKKTKYPKQIYVEVVVDDDDLILSTYKSPIDAAINSADVEIGIYEFVRIAKVKTKIEVV